MLVFRERLMDEGYAVAKRPESSTVQGASPEFEKSPRSGAIWGASMLKGSLAPLASRVSVAVVGLAVGSGCVEVRMTESDKDATISLLALLALAAALFLVFRGLALFVAWRHGAGTRQHRRRLLKILVAVVAGGMCGVLWVLLITTVLDAAARSGAATNLVVVGVVVALSVAVLLGRSGRLREVMGRSLMTTGFHSLALPIAALISFLVGSAQLGPGGSTRPELSAMILGVKLAGSIATVGLSVGGLLVGVFFVFLGDRLLRQPGRTWRGKADGADSMTSERRG